MKGGSVDVPVVWGWAERRRSDLFARDESHASSDEQLALKRRRNDAGCCWRGGLRSLTRRRTPGTVEHNEG